ncbi:MAG: aminoglycoside phosphotransferase family protein [Actinomycetota bacterium]
MDLPPRSVTLVLCRPDGTVLGSLPPFEVTVPWWQEVGPVVDAAHEVTGVQVTVLRLLGAASDTGCGGPVTYLAEVDAAVDTAVAPLTPWREPVGDHPLRLPYARPGGPAADLAWADEELTHLGRPRTAAPRQVRTWNLSSLWRLQTKDGDAWLKVVPPFFAHEGAVISALRSPDVPTLLAADGPRLLMQGLPGADLYDAEGDVLPRMVSLLVGLQAQWIGRSDELLALGLPDWRGEPFAAAAAVMLERTADQLDLATRRTCERVVAGLPARFAALEACGVPDTLVHGDFHPGNLIGDDTHLALLDWGDCGVGNPLLDRSAFVPRIPPGQRADVLAHWDQLWRAAVPGCDPARAAELAGPVAALRQAVVYDGFVQAIEPSEQVYHASDSARWLRILAGSAAVHS